MLKSEKVFQVLPVVGVGLLPSEFRRKIPVASKGAVFPAVIDVCHRSGQFSLVQLLR